MTMTRTIAAIAALPMLATASQGVAAATGQPGLAVPGDGQPGLSTAPAPPAPSVADYIPDPPPPPARPRPSQQTSPHTDSVIQQPPVTDPDAEQTEPEPSQTQADPHTVRAGDTVVALPDWVDAKTHDKAQAYLDYTEWQIAAGYDALGFPREESDRRAASTITGGTLTAIVGAEVAAVPAAGIGCGVGAVVGGLDGGAVGTAAAGVGMPIGAGIGAGLGCMAGLAVAAVPGIAVGAASGAVLGGATAGALGGGVDVPKPEVPPLIEVAIPVPDLTEPTPASPVVGPLTDAVAVIGAQAETAVDSLRSAIAAMPPLVFDPAAVFQQSS
ncbi:hypothetical protein ACIRRA_42845 [Nocardia sp. NPDC101769]|uniref:hypothetical protein n=1 Tax=Nocardia sp. NPDC101769 TaxID=3364333 RepID=UPI00381D2890